MEKVEMFKAKDGKIFGTMQECIDYEQKGTLREKLLDCRKAFDEYCREYGRLSKKSRVLGCAFNTVCEEFCKITNGILEEG